MEALGHDGPPTNYYTENLITGAPLARCPLRTIQLATPQARAAMVRDVDEHFPAYEEGHLLVAGGFSDQPGPYVDAMRAVGAMKRVAQAKWDAEHPRDTTGGAE